MIGEVKSTPRGFTVVAFQDSYGANCSIQESSAIGDYSDSFDRPGSSYIWLGLDDADPKISAATGWIDYPIPNDVLLSTRMHLNREQVKSLIERLNQWLDSGDFT